MPPPLFIDLLFIHCIANMKWKNDFTKFFIRREVWSTGCGAYGVRHKVYHALHLKPYTYFYHYGFLFLFSYS